MKSLHRLGSKEACLQITRGLIVVLLLLSSRNSIITSTSAVYTWKRPRPSRQTLPTQPVRPSADPVDDRGRGPSPSTDLAEAPGWTGIPPVLSPVSHQHLRTETTKPDYLQFFRAAGVHHPLSPPG